MALQSLHEYLELRPDFFMAGMGSAVEAMLFDEPLTTLAEGDLPEDARDPRSETIQRILQSLEGQDLVAMMHWELIDMEPYDYALAWSFMKFLMEDSDRLHTVFGLIHCRCLRSIDALQFVFQADPDGIVDQWRAWASGS